MKTLQYSLAALVLVAGIAPVCAAKTTTDKSKKSNDGAFPSFEDVKQAVEDHFASQRDYQQGDLLTTSSVASLFGKLEKLNWKVVDRREILKSVLPDSDWLVRQLSGRSGKAFMRQVGEQPDGYDRLDRLRRMPYGQRRVSDMIRSPDGYKLIEYMTTTRGGKNLGRMLSQTGSGRDFNKPTGKIYTELELLKRLKKSYEKEAPRHLTVDMKGSKPGSVEDGADDPNSKNPAKQAPAAPEKDPFEDARTKPHG